jgi:hypothetical protein
MPYKLSALHGITDGLSGALQSTTDPGVAPSISGFLHDGLPGQLVSVVDGGVAPLLSAAVLLAVGGLHILRTRPMLVPRALPL